MLIIQNNYLTNNLELKGYTVLIHIQVVSPQKTLPLQFAPLQIEPGISEITSKKIR